MGLYSLLNLNRMELKEGVNNFYSVTRFIELFGFCSSDNSLKSVFWSLGLFNSHSQITITFQPNTWSFISASLSRSQVALIFCSHHSERVLGSTKQRQPLCPCQKQPFTKITVLYLGRTMSGFPGRVFTFRRYRNPLANRNLRTSISGWVCLPLIRLMLKLRVIWV